MLRLINHSLAAVAAFVVAISSISAIVTVPPAHAADAGGTPFSTELA